MKQMTLATTGFELVTKLTRKREFVDEMNLVIPWSELLSLSAPHAPAGKTGQPPFATEVMLRIHLRQQCFGHSAPAILPQAFLSAKRGHTEQGFRQACIEALTRTEALDFMIDVIKRTATTVSQMALTDKSA